MQFKLPVEEGRFKKRYKRFFADIDFGGETITAHVPNTGSMKGCLEPEAPCRFTVSDDPKRKLKYTLQQIKTSSSWVGINTHLANDLVWEAWEKQLLPHWKSFSGAQREVKINDKSRIDLVLWKGEPELDKKGKIHRDHFGDHKFHFVEVKNVTLAENGLALFPDSVTTRGQKHLQELMDLIDQGHSTELFFMVQRTDCKTFSPADEIDPEYGRLLREAQKKGVKLSAYPFSSTKKALSINASSPLKIKL